MSRRDVSDALRSRPIKSPDILAYMRAVDSSRAQREEKEDDEYRSNSGQ